MPEKLIDEFKEDYRAGVNAHSDFYKRSSEEFAFYSGKQWDATDREVLKREQRPALVFNQVAPVINAVSGTEITNRYESRFLPRTIGDSEFADTMTQIVRYVRQQCDASHEESQAFRDCVICGIGATEFYHTYTKSEYGRTVIERVPINELSWDPSAKKGNLVDAKWLMRGKWIPAKEFEILWGKKALDKVKSSATDKDFIGKGGETHSQTLSNLYASDFKFYDTRQHKVAVFDYQRMNLEFYYIVLNIATGDREFLSPKDFRLIESEISGQTIPGPEGIEIPAFDWVKMPKEVYRRAWIAGDVILEDEETRAKNFTYKFVTGFLDQKDDRIEWFGLMRGMKDPQRWSNKMLSQLVHTVATNPKGAILAEKGVFENPAQARQEWGKPNPFIEVRDGAISRRKGLEIVHGKYPASMERIMELAIEAIPKTSGVNPYISGQVDDLRRTAQSAVQLIQRQGMVILSSLFDALSRYRKEAGRLHLNFIDAFMEEGTIVRIAKDPTDTVGEAVEFKRDWIEKVEYDVVVDEAPLSPTATTEFWNSLMQTDALTILMQTGVLTPDIVVDIMPNVPTSIRQKMKENYQRIQQQQQEMAQQQQQTGEVM
jgi:hypothetical protein